MYFDPHSNFSEARFLKIDSPIGRLRSVVNVFVDRIYWLKTHSSQRKAPAGRAVVFYLYADRERYKDSFKALSYLLSRCHGFTIDIVSIDNFNENKDAKWMSDRHVDIGGDNSQWEFSGWKKGVDFYNQMRREPEIAIFVNDSFLNRVSNGCDLYWFRNAFNSLTLDDARRAAFGKVFAVDPVAVINGDRITHSLTTHFFAMPFSVARRLAFTYFSAAQIEEILPSQYSRQWFADTAAQHVSVAFQQYLVHYLTKEWKGGIAPDPSTWPLLRAKAMALINERLLSHDIQRWCEIRSIGNVRIASGRSPTHQWGTPDKKLTAGECFRRLYSTLCRCGANS